jgi:DNA-binding beta-propeller fold protein YncE
MNMKLKIFGLMVFCVIIPFSGSRSQQPSAWKGTIEYEGGVKVIQNPQAPVYSEFEFELEEDLRIGSEEDPDYMFYRIRGLAVDSDGNILVVDMSNFRVQIFDKEGKYVRTIGRSGQGPGEFERPSGIRINRSNGDIYVRDIGRALDIFNSQGEFKKTVSMNKFIRDFIPIKNTVLAVFDQTSDEELTSESALSVIDDKGEVLNTVVTLPYPMLTRRMEGGGAFSTSTGHELSIHISDINGDKNVYGYSKEYELNVIDGNGKRLLLFRKAGSRPRFTSDEQDLYKRMKFPVPEHKPYFYAVFCDSYGRIYVQRNLTREIIRGYGPIEKTEKKVDIFNEEGFYLYKAVLPPNTAVIKDGFLYTRELEEEEGTEYVVRYRIKNWKQTKPDLNK